MQEQNVSHRAHEYEIRMNKYKNENIQQCKYDANDHNNNVFNASSESLIEIELQRPAIGERQEYSNVSFNRTILQPHLQSFTPDAERRSTSFLSKGISLMNLCPKLFKKA